MLTPVRLMGKRALVSKTIGIAGSSSDTYFSINDANGRNAGFRFTMTEPGILRRIRWWDAGTASGVNLRSLLYADDDGSPGTLLASSDYQLVYPSKWPDPWEYVMSEYEMTSGSYWVIWAAQSSGMGTTVVRGIVDQAGFGSGRNNDIASIVNNLGSDWCCEIIYDG